MKKTKNRVPQGLRDSRNYQALAAIRQKSLILDKTKYGKSDRQKNRKEEKDYEGRE